MVVGNHRRWTAPICLIRALADVRERAHNARHRTTPTRPGTIAPDRFCSHGRLLSRWLPVVSWLPDDALRDTFTFMTDVKNRRRGATRISSKHQITIPADALRAAGLEVGDRVVARSDGAGRVILEREHDVLAEFAGAMTGAYHPDEVGELREEWA